MSVSLPTLEPISFLMASLASYTLRSSCHNRAMIVGDGQGLVKTKVVDREKDLTAKQDCLFESESVEAKFSNYAKSDVSSLFGPLSWTL